MGRKDARIPSRLLVSSDCFASIRWCGVYAGYHVSPARSLIPWRNTKQMKWHLPSFVLLTVTAFDCLLYPPVYPLCSCTVLSLFLPLFLLSSLRSGADRSILCTSAMGARNGAHTYIQGRAQLFDDCEVCTMSCLHTRALPSFVFRIS